MLVSFSVRNYRTFKERVEWSLIASADKTREDDNVVDLPQFGLRLLKSAVVYGANASGKSKLVEAIKYMQRLVLGSSKNLQIGDLINTEPFKLNSSLVHASSEFEIQFVHHNELYRYGFEVSTKKIESEWLFRRAPKEVRRKPEIELFYRSGQDVNFNANLFGGILNELIKNDAVRENALLLSVAAQFNHQRAKRVFEWFREMLLILSGSDEDWERAFTLMLIKESFGKNEVLSFFAKAGLGIQEIRTEEESEHPFEWKEGAEGAVTRLRDWSKQEHANVMTMHKLYNNYREVVGSVELSLSQDESTGTQKMLTLAGPVIGTLAREAVLIVDELDARLHPNLSSKIVQLFNSKETNPNNAQLLFNTHDTNLLSSGNFRRDQIWFTEKNRYGEATLYSLADFKTDKVRKDENFEANYVQGKYGAVPYLGDFNALPKAAPAAETAPPHEQPE